MRDSGRANCQPYEHDADKGVSKRTDIMQLIGLQQVAMETGIHPVAVGLVAGSCITFSFPEPLQSCNALIQHAFLG